MKRWNSSLRFLLSAALVLSMLITPVTPVFAGAGGTPTPSANVSNTVAESGEQSGNAVPAQTETSPTEEDTDGNESKPLADIDTDKSEAPEEGTDAGHLEENTISEDGAVQPDKAVNLALNKGADAFTLEMEGAGTDKDPATKDVTIREKEEKSLPRLTDGYYGTGSILDGNWNGEGMRSKYYEAYRNVDRVITLDLGQVSYIETLSFHMQEGTPWGISAPSVVTYYLSEDGKAFHRVGRVTRFDAEKDTDPTHTSDIMDKGAKVGECVSYYFRLDDLNYNARYVKLTFELTGTWAFADELEVLGKAVASDEADALPDTPGTENEVVGHYATAAQSRGIKHEGLAYAGHYISDNTLKTSEKTVDELLPMVGYVDADGKVTDTFFDSLTFLSHGYTPNTGGRDQNDFYNHLIYDASKMGGMEDPASICATREDWETYLDFLFTYTDGTGAKYNLDALEEAVAQVKEATGKADYEVGVKIAFYPPILCQDDWGTLPGGSRSLNFKVSETNTAEQALADRMAASRWYMDEVVSRFNAKNYKNIRLDGFYWYDEVMHYDVDPLVLETAQGVTSYVHSLNGGAYQIYWIPFYQASGFRAWKSFGFDYAIMQPNYAFDANASEQRITDTAELCKKYGLGIEMEFGGISDKYITQFRQYLTNGADSKLGYQNNSLIAWYTGTWGISETSQDKAGTRYIYDAMYDFFTGKVTTMEKPVKNYAEDGKLTLEVGEIKNEDQYAANKEALPKLVDGDQKSGVWGDGSYIMINKNFTAGPFALTDALDYTVLVEQLSLDFIGETGSGIGVPDAVTYSVSKDGTAWTEIGKVTYADAKKKTVSSGCETVDYVLSVGQPVQAAYIRAEFNHGTDTTRENELWTWLAVDEFTLLGRVPKPAASAADGTITLESENIPAGQESTFAERQKVAAKLLNNGKMLSGSWANVNTENGDYVGLLQGVAAGPYTVQIAFDLETSVRSFGMDFMTWESSGVGAPEKVAYYSSVDGKIWTEAAVLEKADAKFYPDLATGVNGYHFLAELDSPLTAKYLKAVFERGHNPEKDAPWGWVAFDEFTVQVSTDEPGTDPTPGGTTSTPGGSSTTNTPSAGGSSTGSVPEKPSGSVKPSETPAYKPSTPATPENLAKDNWTAATTAAGAASFKHTEADGTASTGVRYIETSDGAGVRYVFNGDGTVVMNQDTAIDAAIQVTAEGEVLVNGNLYYLNPDRDVRDPRTCYVMMDYLQIRDNYAGQTYFDKDGITFQGWMKNAEGGLRYQTRIPRPDKPTDLYLIVWRVQTLPACQHPDHPGDPAYFLPAGRYFFDDEGVLVQKEGWNDGKDGKEYYTNAQGMVTQERTK